MEQQTAEVPSDGMPAVADDESEEVSTHCNRQAEDVCQGSAAVVGGDYSWTGAVQTGPAAGGGDGGGSMGLEIRGVLAQDCPEF